MKNELVQLGLSEYEAQVYLAVMELGPCTAGPLVKKTVLHRMNVYSALRHLEEMHLISIILKNNRQHFQGTNPENILTPLVERERLVKQLIPKLNALKSHRDTQMGVSILYGIDGFWQNLQDVIHSAAKHDRIMRIIGGAPDTQFYKAIGKHYASYKELLRKEKISKWLLSPEAESKEFKTKFMREPQKNRLKTLPKGLSSPTYTRITPQMVSIEIYATPMMIIQIRNSAVAGSYMDHFDLLWNGAK